MPKIYDNIDLSFLPALREEILESHKSDFCVGYFNLRGWKSISDLINNFSGGEEAQCRLLVGMKFMEEEELKEALRISQNKDEVGIDNKTANQLKKKLAFEFKKQLTYGLPTTSDEAGLRRLAKQLRDKKVVVKYFVRFNLHAKLYLCYKNNADKSKTGFVGSSNLTFAGLKRQGELNVDVEDNETTQKLEDWFIDRWEDRWAIDITDDLIEILENSWATEELVSPYYIYLKMAYHLAKEAREGITEFKLPKEFEEILFEFQKAAVKIATHHIHRRNGVLIGDVVGFGKTYMATAIARIIFDDFHWRILVLCPANLRKMWKEFFDEYQVPVTIRSHAQTIKELPELKRHHLVIIDESHNFRNRKSKRFKAVRDYITLNDCKVILLSATPYNKSFHDLSTQLRLFMDESDDLGIRPEAYIKQLGAPEKYHEKHQAPIRSIGAFEQSEHVDDWRELMRLFMIRRTRSFIIDNYALRDNEDRPYLLYPNGDRYYFPTRYPKNIDFEIDENDPNDDYAKLYSQEVVDIINSLELARYGLGNYKKENPVPEPSKEEKEILENLSQAGKRLMGFCRTNLFKRLESSGEAFILSIIRHIQRNYVFIYVIENDLELPIGTQEAEIIDTLFKDDEDGGDDNWDLSEKAFRERAEAIFTDYQTNQKNKYTWIRSDLFKSNLGRLLKTDADKLMKVLDICPRWQPENDRKLDALHTLLEEKHANEKVLIFSQFADTVNFLREQLDSKNISDLDSATGQSANPTQSAYKFSPKSNKQSDKIKPEDETRVLLATDVLSEGQNLQDGYIIVNYDLPWAIIRLIQRAGRVDRIGQESEIILCYSFKPAKGVEKIINLRHRLLHRLNENAEVVGTDEEFFPDQDSKDLIDLYNEKSGILDGEDDKDVDLASHAFEIWNQAIKENPELEKKIQNLANVSHGTKNYSPTENKPDGALVYVKTAQNTDALTWISGKGENITESQFAILNAAECSPEEPALPRRDDHYELEAIGVKKIMAEQGKASLATGNLGRPSGARYKTYIRLKSFLADNEGMLWDTPELNKAIEEIYNHPLKQSAIDKLNRQLKSGIQDYLLAELVTSLSQGDMLCNIQHEDLKGEPQIICSMGLVGEE
ncbi:NgoFVII family restriction endonuclease [candidate division KSB1 bacterium]|nr:NgoFVII family restriction endonuclease [candidate division KSB1 bacterium]